MNVSWNAVEETTTNFYICKKKRREGRLKASIRIDQEVYEKALEDVNAMYERLNVEKELEKLSLLVQQQEDYE